MSTPDQRARDKDRSAAIEIVEAAWAQGQIVEADRDKRVEEIARAQTLGEIATMTRDLRPAGPTPPATERPPAPPPPPAYAAPETYVPYGPPTTTSDEVALAGGTGGASPLRVSKAVIIVPLVLVATVGIAIVGGIVAVVNSVSDSSTSATYAPGEEPEKGDVNVISTSGYADLLDAVRAETGSTTAFGAVLYPTYAVVQLPVDDTTQRENRYYWDGRELADQDSKGTSTEERFDLRSVDPAVVVRLVNKVRRLSDQPTSWYAVVGGPTASDQAIIWAYASNEYNESVYVGARRDGTIVYDSTNP